MVSGKKRKEAERSGKKRKEAERSGKKRKEAERSGTSYGKRDQAGQAEPGQAELAWTGGGVRPNPPTPPSLRACIGSSL